MKKIQCLLFCTLITMLISCSNNNNFVATYKADINGKGDWINSRTIGKFGGATGGEYCSKIDSSFEYSYGFSKLLNEISPNLVKRIKVGVSVKLDKLDKKSFLIVSVNGPNNEKIYWTGHELTSIAKETGKWYKLNVEDVLPNGYKPEGASVGIYVWNPNKNVVYVDDYVIQFLPE